MRILHVIANLAPRYGGPSKACFEMARAVARLGHTVAIYTTNQDRSSQLDVPTSYPVFKDGVEIRYFPIQRPYFWGTSIPLALALRKAIPGYDIVHIHSLYLFHCAVAGYYCRKYNIPYLIRPHGTLDPYIYNRHRHRKSVMEQLFENKNIKNAAAMHFTTEEEKRLAEPYIFQKPGVVVPHGLDLAEYNHLPEPGVFRFKYPEIGGKRIILFLGRLNFKKGLDILAQAFVRLVQIHNDIHLVIAGPDDDGLGSKVHKWLEDAGVLDSVVFTGMLQGPDKLAALKDAYMFVLPSYSENFGISVIEAMACGLPVIISDKVNIWREVEANEAGRVASCDAKHFAEAILHLLDNPELARQMGEKGKNLVRRRFQWSSVALAMQDAYRSILRGKFSE